MVCRHLYVNTMRLILTAILILFSFQTLTAQRSALLDQKHAVELARNFVAKKGYVRKLNKRTLNPSKLRLLEPEPVIALIKENNGKKIWSVQFYFADQGLKDVIYDNGESYHFGREVKILLDGSKIWMQPLPLLIRVSVMGDCLS